jgi:hypothetical protein
VARKFKVLHLKVKRTTIYARKQYQNMKNAFKSMFKKNERGEANNADHVADDDEPLSEDEKNSHNSEVLEEQNKSILWAVLKQIKVCLITNSRCLN